jgi:2-methylcitrate dehydratase PrpD
MEQHFAFGRRAFLEAGALSLFAAPGVARRAQAAEADAITQPAAGGKKPSQAIADYVAGFDLREVPPLAIERARTLFIDTVGVMLAGSRMPAASIVAGMIEAEGAAPSVGIVGRSTRTSPQLAALANGVASHGMDYDFTYVVGQSVAPVIPALLPLAEQRGTAPAELLAAFIIGFDVTSRIARGNPTHSAVGGWHGTGTIGTIAAAAACARLLKASPAATANIVGISASLASGLQANFGSMTKPLHAGHAARNGMVAALLGANGFTANESALEGPSGFFPDFARGLDWSLVPFADLGAAYDIAERGFSLKPYPCGGLAHAAIDAALALRQKLGARIAEIRSVTVGTTQHALDHISDRYPVTVENAKFSLPYVIAYALLHGAPLLAAFTDEAIADERLRSFAPKVSGGIEPSFPNSPSGAAARVAVLLADGSLLEEVRLEAVGTPKLPMSETQIAQKFFDCAAQAVPADRAQQIYAMLATLGPQTKLADLWPLLRG